MATFAQQALARKVKFDAKLAQYGQSIIRIRQANAYSGTTESRTTYKAITDNKTPQYPTSYQDVGGSNIGSDDSRKILYFTSSADITEKDLLSFNGYEYNVTLAFPFVLSDVKIYLEVTVSRMVKN